MSTDYNKKMNNIKAIFLSDSQGINIILGCTHSNQTLEVDSHSSNLIFTFKSISITSSILERIIENMKKGLNLGYQVDNNLYIGGVKTNTSYIISFELKSEGVEYEVNFIPCEKTLRKAIEELQKLEQMGTWKYLETGDLYTVISKQKIKWADGTWQEAYLYEGQDGTKYGREIKDFETKFVRVI